MFPLHSPFRAMPTTGLRLPGRTITGWTDIGILRAGVTFGVRGYWAHPPYAGGYWVAPHYCGGRFFGRFWGGRHEVVRGFVRNDYRNSGQYTAPQESYRASESHSYSFRRDCREERSGDHFERGRH